MHCTCTHSYTGTMPLEPKLSDFIRFCILCLAVQTVQPQWDKAGSNRILCTIDVVLICLELLQKLVSRTSRKGCSAAHIHYTVTINIHCKGIRQPESVSLYSAVQFKLC